MKKLSVLLVAAAMLFTVACKKEGVSLINGALRDKPTDVKDTFKWIKNVNRGQVVKILEKQGDGEWMKVQLADGQTEGWIQKIFIHEGKKEIVEFSEKASLHDQPDADSKEIGQIPAGTKALVLGKKDQWLNVSVTWQQRGWVKSGAAKPSSDTKSQAATEVYIPGIGKCIVEASSTFADTSGYSFSVANCFDKDPGTAWQEGVGGDGVGEWIEVTFPEPQSIKVSMVNGMAKKDARFAKEGADGDLYLLNGRVKSLKVQASDSGDATQSSTVGFEDDQREPQDAGMYQNVKKIRFIIDGVYKGAKWADTSIGEIRIEKQ